MAKRLTVILPDEVAAALEAIAARNGSTLTEAAMRCLATESVISALRDEGYRILTAANDGRGAVLELVWRHG